MNPIYQSRWLPFVLLTFSNVFMTFAWYGQLKFPKSPLWVVIPVSWGIALFEYCLAVPANRWGSNVYSLVQLKVAQEIITLAVFSTVAILFFKTTIRWNHVVAFGLIVAAAGFTFLPQK